MKRQYRPAVSLVAASISVVLLATAASAQNQTPGQITKFDSIERHCDDTSTVTADQTRHEKERCELRVVDSVITQDPSGNIGIGTTAPAAKLDVADGNLNLDDSSSASGNILKSGALFIHNSGNENTFIGIRAGNSTTSGDSNTASGYEALENDTVGRGNTAIGQRALESNIDGPFNTAVGASALWRNVSGHNNVAVGDALASNVNGADNTAIGSSAMALNTEGFVNTAVGLAALEFNTTGAFNIAVGDFTLRSNITGRGNTAIGTEADVATGDLTNATAIGGFAVVNASNKIRLGNTAVTVIEGAVPYTFTSDRNQKQNFQAVDGEEVLRKLGGVNISSWNYIGHDPQQFRHYGPVAQEFFAAFGHDGVGTIGTPTTINSGDLEGILMIAVQALEKQNAALRTRIEALEQAIRETQVSVSQSAK